MAKRKKKQRPAKAKPTARRKSTTRPKAKAEGKAKARSGSAGPRSIPAGNAQVKKKLPARTVKPSGQRPTTRRATTKEPARKKLPKKPAAVKTRRGKPPQPARRKKPGSGSGSEPGSGRRKAPLSRHPDAVRARKYRRERKAIADALAIEHEEKLARRRERAAAKKRAGVTEPLTDRELARGWLETIRDHCAELVPTSLDVTTDDPQTRGVWIAVGRFTFMEPVSYLGLGDILEHILADDLLAARIHPSRLTQIRVLFIDPGARERSGPGSYLSKIAGWEFALGDLIGEVLGGGASDEMSLAVRYDASTIPAMYIYFSAETKTYTTAAPFMKTATLKI